MHQQEQQKEAIILFPNGIVKPPTKVVKSRNVDTRESVVLASCQARYANRWTGSPRNKQQIVVGEVIELGQSPCSDETWTGV
jgi:hypothetical protein